jgi:hypothetical protein
MKNAKALFFAALMSATGIALGDGCSSCSTCPKPAAKTVCTESGCTVTPAAASAAPAPVARDVEGVDVDAEGGLEAEIVEVDVEAEVDARSVLADDEIE